MAHLPADLPPSWRCPSPQKTAQGLPSAEACCAQRFTEKCPFGGWRWGREGGCPVPGIVRVGGHEVQTWTLGVSLQGPASVSADVWWLCSWGLNCAPAPTDDHMEGVDSERRPHFPQFSYSASGTA